jgi:hypothetical protein
MTVEQAYETLLKNGHFPLLVVTIDDFMDYLKENQEPEPTDDAAMEALQMLHREWENGDEFISAMQMTAEYLEEIESVQS